MKKAVKVSSEMLSGAKAAENALARQEVRELADSIPEGHILHDEIEQQKAMMGGDLSDLPPGHPLFRAMLAAKKRYEEEQAEASEEDEVQKQRDEAQEKAKVKKAKRLDERKARQKRIAREVEAEEALNKASQAVNKEIAATLESVKKLYGSLAEYEEILNTRPLMRARTLRLKRFLYATEKGLSSNRMGRA